MNKNVIYVYVVFLLTVLLLSTTGCNNQAHSQQDIIQQQFNKILEDSFGGKMEYYKNVEWKLPVTASLPSEPTSIVFSFGGNPDEPELNFDIQGEGFFITGTERAVNGEVVIDKLNTNLPKGSVDLK